MILRLLLFYLVEYRWILKLLIFISFHKFSVATTKSYTVPIDPHIVFVFKNYNTFAALKKLFFRWFSSIGKTEYNYAYVFNNNFCAIVSLFLNYI